MLWIVGNIFKDFRDYLESHAIEYGVFVNASKKISTSLTNIPTIPLDFRSSESIVASLKEKNIEVSALVVAGYENYVLPASILAAHYNLPATSVDSALAATDKARMRAQFMGYNTAITPAFMTIESWQDIESFVRQHGLPVMLKPTNLMKSLFVTKNSSLEELRHNYDHVSSSLGSINDRIYTLEPPEIIVEECMEGSMHTVAGFVNHAGDVTLFNHIVDCITGQDIGRNDNFLYSRQLPTSLPPEKVNAILEVAEQGVRALGLTSSMLHIEIMLTEAGPKIIEIGARIGGYRSRMYVYASGLDMQAMLIDLAYGRTPKLPTTSTRSTAAIELFPENTGTFAGISNQTGLENLASFQYLSIKATSDKPIGPSKEGHKAAAVIILGNKDHAQFLEDLAYVRTHVNVSLQD